MAMHQIHHDDPFRNLRAMHAVGAAQWDLGVSVDGVLCHMVRSCGEELNEFEVRSCFAGGGEPHEGCQVGCAGDDVYCNMISVDYLMGATFRVKRKHMGTTHYHAIGTVVVQDLTSAELEMDTYLLVHL
jgi:hypothetical protein